MKKKILFLSFIIVAAVLFIATNTVMGAAEMNFADSAVYTDFSIEYLASFGDVPGEADTFFCYSGNNSTYKLNINELKNKVSLYSYINGAENRLWERSCDIRSNHDYRIRLIFSGSVFTFYIDNVLISEDTFPKLEMPLTELESGKIGFTSSDSVKISDISVSEPEEKNVDFASSYKNPVMDGADPDVLYYDGVYYLYNVTSGDNAIFKVSTSTDLVNWYYEGVVYFNDPTLGIQGYMSPNVFYYDGLFYLIFAANPKEGVSQKLFYAVSDSPTGVFKHKNGPVTLHDNVREIGGHPFVDDDGQVYITLCRFNKTGGYIAVQKVLVADGVITPLDDTITTVVEPTDSYETDEDRAHTAEGGVFTKHNGKYYMIYATGAYDKHYGEGYAVSDTILGEYKKYQFNDFLTYNSKVDGAGDAVIVPSPDGSELFLVYHAHYSTSQVNKRQVYIDRIRFEKDPYGGDDILTVYGPTISPQPYPSGAEIKSENMPEIFDSLPVVYLDVVEGNDTNDGTMYRPLKTITAAYNAIAPAGGTIVLLRNVNLNDISDRAYFVTPKNVTGDVYIRAVNDGIRIEFKYLSLSCNHYFDHVTFLSETDTPIIEACFNNLFIGENVAAFSSSKIENQYPFIVGGHYLYGDGSDNANSVKSPWIYYTAKNKSFETISTDKDYTITVLGGKWRSITGGNLREYGTADVGTINGAVTLEIGGSVKILPKETGSESSFVSALGMNSLGSDGSVTLKISGGEFFCPVYAVGSIGIRSVESTGDYYVGGEIKAYITGGEFHDFAAGTAFSKEGGVYLSQDTMDIVNSVVYTDVNNKDSVSGFSCHEYLNDVNSETSTIPAETSGTNNDTAANGSDTIIILVVCLAGIVGLATIIYMIYKRKK